MARMTCKLIGELDLVHDAIDEIQAVMRAIVKCHGVPYRALERRIERFMEGEVDWGEPKSHWIGGGRFIMEPWPEMKSIIREARELGVLS